jgi:hypothetical protein
MIMDSLSYGLIDKNKMGEIGMEVDGRKKQA